MCEKYNPTMAASFSCPGESRVQYQEEVGM